MNAGSSHISLADARRAVASKTAPLAPEMVSLTDAIGRSLAEPLQSLTSLPPFDNSAMDGFALRSADTAGAGTEPARLLIAGESRAGHPATGTIEPGSAARISTGAAMPPGTDAVLRIEDALIDGETLIVSRPIATATDVRPSGDDIRGGETVLEAGITLGAGEIAMATAAGAAGLRVTRRPKVTIVSTGDELVPAGEPLGPGKIYDSNSMMIAAQVKAAGGELGSLIRRVADTSEAVDKALLEGLSDADVLVVCGGVSVGEHDHVKNSLARAGVKQEFWQVAMRPGHPTWFGTRQRDDSQPQLVFGLPGNPVSAYVTFELYVAPALRTLAGSKQQPLTLTARYAGTSVHKKPGFAHVVRCTLAEEDGELVARLTAENQRSHSIASLVSVSALGFIDESRSVLDEGDLLRLELLDAKYTYPGR